MISNTRAFIVLTILMLGIIFLNLIPQSRVTPIKKPLEYFPKYIGNWTFMDQEIFSVRIENILGVDNYIQYNYKSSENRRINLYVSYFSSQKEGKGFHSPKNCMPGSGWDVIQEEPAMLKIHHSDPSLVKINKMIIQKGSEQALVLYWYQSRGRIIRSEYMQKIYMVLDSILKHRTDGSFIRIMAPVEKGETVDFLYEFAAQVIYILEEYLPGA